MRVAPGDHDAVGHLDDLVDMLYAFVVLDFGDDRDTVAAVLLQEVADFKHVVPGAHKGCGDNVHVLLDAE